MMKLKNVEDIPWTLQVCVYKIYDTADNCLHIRLR